MRLQTKYSQSKGRWARLSTLALAVLMVFVLVAEIPVTALTAEERRTNTRKGISFLDEACSVIPESNAGSIGTISLEGHNLPADRGGTGFEEVVNERGQVPSTGGFVTFAGNIQNAPTEKKYDDPRVGKENSEELVSMQQLYQWYYITMRWRYAVWNWNGSASSGPEKVDFYQRAPRVLVTNPRTKQSIIAVVLEAGPAPWTGVDTNNNNNPKQGWKNPQDGTPPTYKGRVSGFPPEAIKNLGATMRMADGSGDELIYTWAEDQNAIPGLPPGGSSAPAAEEGSCIVAQPTVIDGDYFRASDKETCAAGQDAGIEDGYAGGKLFRIRLCRVHGIRVNALVAVQVNNMMNLAKSEGKDFSGSGGFRTMAEQIVLRKKNGCPSNLMAPSSQCRVPTAPPGYSNHQMGLAIDFRYQGGGISNHSNGGFIWLNKNAATFGFKNFPKEAWHWSVNGK